MQRVLKPSTVHPPCCVASAPSLGFCSWQEELINRSINPNFVKQSTHHRIYAITQSNHNINTLSMAFPTRDTLLWMSLWSEASFWTVSFILLQHCVITSEIVPDKSPSWSRQDRGKLLVLLQTNHNIKSLHMQQHIKTRNGIKRKKSKLEYLQS